MDISNRIRGFQASPIRRLSPYARAAKERGIKVYHLNIGQPDIKSPVEAIKAIHNYPNEIIAYGESDGDMELRKALVKYYHDNVGVDISVDDVLITTGGSEAILFSLMTLCDPGDEVIVPEPYYTNVHSFARMANVSIVSVTSLLEDNFALPPLKTIEEKITSKTRAILLNSPNNPTGHIYSPKELETILKMCEDHDIFLIVDEVYREFCYDGLSFTSILKYEQYAERVICIDSVSKRFSMCGARVGALISRNRNVIRETLKLSQARLCSPTVEQHASLAAFSAPPEYLESVKAEYEKRRNFIVKSLHSIPGVKCARPNGAFYLIARLPVEDAEDFAIFMLRDFDYKGETVMLAPAEGFYESKDLGRDQVRIAYVLNTDDLAKACTCLKEGLKAYNSRSN
ncbi:MAG: pyridoxal phosphate-dependent aminotransferase [Spirochaetales bacterium]|nr:pyridoxal phosphate-dependent aminotransferase [Spirochaetales bacterium]MBO6049003.1 pyridoxal phosphate-dependent aminotransferase [Spirochaetales bacterium]MBO7348900.1 pyridoxal phosphate-dependent aminotransferase [Spirochaetales bacterium]MBP5756620.1 pyridoxal phosphate-dependent aminotransferase [Spirochaetales bacterium]